jgi:peptidoglycan/LPS O-acetylase OafA/YrhL
MGSSSVATTAAGEHAPSAGSRDFGPGRIPALDGIRAIAIVAVLLYHLDFAGAKGGFLGVEVFFALSGYLITTLLLREHDRHGAIALTAFWWRRLRRLARPMIVAIVVTAGVGAVLHAADLVRFRGDGLASLLFVENWWAIVHHQPYFQSFGRPSPFLHLWSLAIEGQFYVLWPLALAATLRCTTMAKAWLLTLAGAAISLWAMAHMADITTIDRVYYGTDTRAFGLLLGAALAFLWGPGRLQSERAATARHILDAIAGVALLALVWQFIHRSEFDGWTFPWGLLWVDGLTLAIVVTAVVPGTAVGRVLGLGPMAALGRRSYSLYLWHWPVIVLLRPGDTALSGPSLTALRIVLIVGLAELSYRLVELRRQPRRSTQPEAARRRALGVMGRTPAWSLTAVIVGIALVLTGFVTLHSPHPSTASAQDLPETVPMPISATNETPTTAPTPSTTTITTPTVVSTTDPTAPPPPARPPGRDLTPVSVVGDSVTLGAQPELEARFVTAAVDAKVSRQFNETLSLVRDLAARSLLASTVVVQVGNNGPIPASDLQKLLEAVGPRRLVLVTVEVPRPWEGEVNDTLHDFVRRTPEVGLADWETVAASEPGLLEPDQLHLTAGGARRYVDVIQQAVDQN